MNPEVIELLAGITVGFVFWKLFAGQYEGDRVEHSIRPKIYGYRVHVHHWIWCSVLLIVLLMVDYRYDYNHVFMVGFLLGSIIQGLVYRDRFIIVYKDEEFEAIYARFKDQPRAITRAEIE